VEVREEERGKKRKEMERGTEKGMEGEGKRGEQRGGNPRVYIFKIYFNFLRIAYELCVSYPTFLGL